MKVSFPSVLSMAASLAAIGCSGAASIGSSFMGVPVHQVGYSTKEVIPVLDATTGNIEISTGQLAEWLGVPEMPGARNGTFAKQVLVNYEAQQPVVALYNGAIADQDMLTALALYNVLTTGGLLMSDYFTPQSTVNSEAMALYTSKGINTGSFARMRIATNALVSALVSSVPSSSSDSSTTSKVKRVSYTVKCDGSHVPPASDCQKLINDLRPAYPILRNHPRNIEYGRCYTSWSKDTGGLSSSYLISAANAMYNACVVHSQSGKANNAILNGVTCTQCLSDRATDCH